MNGENIIDSWIDWQFNGDYELGTDSIWYPIDDTKEVKEAENV